MSQISVTITMINYNFAVVISEFWNINYGGFKIKNEPWWEAFVKYLTKFHEMTCHFPKCQIKLSMTA